MKTAKKLNGTTKKLNYIDNDGQITLQNGLFELNNNLWGPGPSPHKKYLTRDIYTVFEGACLLYNYGIVEYIPYHSSHA